MQSADNDWAADKQHSDNPTYQNVRKRAGFAGTPNSVVRYNGRDTDVSSVRTQKYLGRDVDPSHVDEFLKHFAK